MTSAQCVHLKVIFRPGWRAQYSSPAFLNHFGRRYFRLDFRNGDDGVGGFNEQFDVAQFHCLAGPEPGFLDGFAVEKRAVGGIAVAQIDAVVGERHLAMQRRNGVMI